MASWRSRHAPIQRARPICSTTRDSPRLKPYGPLGSSPASQDGRRFAARPLQKPARTPAHPVRAALPSPTDCQAASSPAAPLA